MNDNIRNIELVKKSYEELQDEVIKLTTNKFILQSNWNSLREWFEEKDNNGFEKFYIEDVLYKMNELEGGKNNE